MRHIRPVTDLETLNLIKRIFNDFLFFSISGESYTGSPNFLFVQDENKYMTGGKAFIVSYHSFLIV